MNSFEQIRRTGIGAVNVPFTGKKIRFDDDGNYPTSSIEHMVLENRRLQRRNQFLEDAMTRACYDNDNYSNNNDDGINLAFNMDNYVYC